MARTRDRRLGPGGIMRAADHPASVADLRRHDGSLSEGHHAQLRQPGWR